MKRLFFSLAFTVVFWNVENLFDWHDGGYSASDTEFSATGRRHWTAKRFYTKCNGIAKTLLMMSDSLGGPPDVVGLAEVENDFVLRQLIWSTALRKYGYRAVHFESPDRRGIDCALLYRSVTVEMIESFPRHIRDSTGRTISTRDILVARLKHSGNEYAVLVNHHPSKVGNGSEVRRRIAMDTMNAVCDSLEASGETRIICVGDFNDDVWKAAKTHGKRQCTDGTIKFNGRWEKIDGSFCRGVRTVEGVWSHPLLSTADKKFGGLMPLRTYNGLKYQGGLSDHYPIFLVVGD